MLFAVVDDHPLWRTGLEVELKKAFPTAAVLQARDGEDYEQQCAGGVRPDLALVDYTMRPRDGLATLQWIRQAQPGTRAVLISVDPYPELVRAAMAAGSMGALHKSVDAQELLQAVATVLAGDFHHNWVMRDYLAWSLDPARVALQQRALELTARDLEYCRLQCQAKEPTDAAMAHAMGVKERTVAYHREQAYRKLGVHTRVELLHALVQLHLVACPCGVHRHPLDPGGHGPDGPLPGAAHAPSFPQALP